MEAPLRPTGVRALGCSVTVLALVGAVAVAAAPPAGACSCGPATEQEHFRAADAVFVADVAGLAEVELPSGGHVHVWSLAVGSTYKGAVHAAQQVVSKGPCGVYFGADDRYLVFAHLATEHAATGAEGQYHVWLCSGTRTLSQEPVPPTFGEERAPLPAEPGDLAAAIREELPPGPGAPPLLLLAIGALGLGWLVTGWQVSRGRSQVGKDAGA